MHQRDTKQIHTLIVFRWQKQPSWQILWLLWVTEKPLHQSTELCAEVYFLFLLAKITGDSVVCHTKQTFAAVWKNILTCVLVFFFSVFPVGVHTWHEIVSTHPGWLGAAAHSRYITVFICLVIAFSIPAQGQWVRWVCGTSGVNKLYDYREPYSAPLSPLRREYVS